MATALAGNFATPAQDVDAMLKHLTALRGSDVTSRHRHLGTTIDSLHRAKAANIQMVKLSAAIDAAGSASELLALATRELSAYDHLVRKVAANPHCDDRVVKALLRISGNFRHHVKCQPDLSFELAAYLIGDCYVPFSDLAHRDDAEALFDFVASSGKRFVIADAELTAARLLRLSPSALTELVLRGSITAEARAGVFAELAKLASVDELVTFASLAADYRETTASLVAVSQLLAQGA